jgi:AcrR family transcriptional regulator
VYGAGDIQRARLIAAASEVAVEQGVAKASVAHIVARAGVSRRTFYQLFADREDCFLAALDQAVALAAAEASASYEAEAKWVDGIRAALYALLALFDEQPTLARLLIVQTLGGGPRAIQRRGDVLAELSAAVERGRGQARASEAALTPLTAEAIVGGALSLVHSRICEGGSAPLVDLARPLMAMIVLPYLGAAAARREIARSAPKRRRRSPPAPASPLRELPIRLTYRTVLALQAIAAQPGSSNRGIGRAASIEDQGQTSKLLGRLERVGLVVNDRAHELRGAPNAWMLTPDGAAVLQVVGCADGRLDGAQGRDGSASTPSGAQAGGRRARRNGR